MPDVIPGPLSVIGSSDVREQRLYIMRGKLQMHSETYLRREGDPSI